MAAGCLYVVATPIGNLEDMAPRAVRVLGEVDRIAAEDTRHSRKLLSRFHIHTPLISYHEHNEQSRGVELLNRLEAGESLAIISDAGTPCISDPGYRLVRAAAERGVPVRTIPGPCAVTAALSISGLPPEPFAFHGFFPRNAGKAQRLLERIGEWEGAHILFESPNRLPQTIHRISEALPDAKMAIVHEMTKMHEGVFQGAARELAAQLKDMPSKGEYVLVVCGGVKAGPGAALSDETLREEVEAFMEGQSLSRRDAVRAVAQQHNISRNRVYAAATAKGRS
ncbi:MAG: 16S rRNA (cytidine(1402)-2'-O)-methyltransferase [Candidatus Hydrogenedentota bacterium]